MAIIPAAGFFSNQSLINLNFKSGLDDLVASLRHVPWSGQIELTATITSGIVTPPGSGGVLIVDTEGGAATDDLSQIITTNYPDGAFLLVRNANENRVVVVKHAIGGIGTTQLNRNVDYALDDTKKWLLLRRKGNDWYEIKRGPMRLVTEAVVKSATFTVQKQDIGKVFICTGTYTVALAAAAGCGNGFVFGIRNAGTGTLTVDPNGAELIDGASTMTIPVGWTFEFICSGTAWTMVKSDGPSTLPNPIINGKMEVWQRGTSRGLTLVAGVGTGATGYLADRWRLLKWGPGTVSFTVSRSTNVPTFAQAGHQINYSLEIDVTTAHTAPVGADSAYIYQTIDQSTWRHFAQRQFTLSFWVMSTKTGTYGIRLGDARCYAQTYTINTTNTWEFKSFVIPPSPYWVLSEMPIQFGLLEGGSNVVPITGSWTNVLNIGSGVTGQVNALDSTANFFRLTAVRLDAGSLVLPWEVNSFEMEYLRCLRSYQKSFNYGQTPQTNLGLNSGEFTFSNPINGFAGLRSPLVGFRVPMRQNPTINFYNPEAANSMCRNQSLNTDDGQAASAGNISQFGFTVSYASQASWAIGHRIGIHWDVAFEV